MKALGQYVLNEDGEPVEEPDLLVWAEWMATADRRICSDLDEGDGEKRIHVSTIFLGIDHRLFGEGPPLLWETMVFGGPIAGEQRRYASKAAAFQGHQQVCQKLMEALAAERQAEGGRDGDRDTD